MPSQLRLPPMLPLREIQRRRCEELRTFFRARFGNAWQKELRLRLGGPRTRLLFLTRPHAPFSESVALERVETLAERLGFTSRFPELRPFERNRMQEFRALNYLRTLRNWAPGLDPSTEILCWTLQHKARRPIPRSDVLSEEFTLPLRPDTGTPSPSVVNEPPPAQDLDPDPVPVNVNGGGPAPTGGGGPPVGPLSGPGENSDPPRLKIVRVPVFVPAWVPADGTHKWHHAVRRIVDGLDEVKAEPHRRVNALSRLLRYVEGKIHRAEMEERLAAGEDPVPHELPPRPQTFRRRVLSQKLTTFSDKKL